MSFTEQRVDALTLAVDQMALASHTPLSTELSEFDEMLITKNIATREACLKCKGFTAEQVSEIMAGDEEELEAETSMKLAAVIVNDEAGANGGDDDDSYEDSDADDDQALRAYREARVAEVRAAQARKAEGGLLLQVSKATWEAEVVAASVGRWVVVHLHADSSLESQTGRGVPQQCAALALALREVAARFAGLRCCQLPALDAIPPSQLGKLPALFCYRDGALMHSLMGAQAFGQQPSAAQLVNMLSEIEVVDPSEGRPMGGAVSEHDSDDLSD